MAFFHVRFFTKCFEYFLATGLKYWAVYSLEPISADLIGACIIRFPAVNSIRKQTKQQQGKCDSQESGTLT